MELWWWKAFVCITSVIDGLFVDFADNFETFDKL